LLAVGYKVKDLDDELASFLNIHKSIENKGLVTAWINDKIKLKLGIENATFKDKI